MAKIYHSNNFIFDVETSGNCPIRNGIISLSCIATDSNLNVIDTFRSRICPPGLSELTWDKEAEEIHGISYEEILNATSNRQFCYDFLNFMVKYKRDDNLPLPFICHASNYGMPSFKEGTKKPNGGYKIVPWFDFTFLEWCFIKEEFQNSFYKVFTKANLISTVKMGREQKYKGNKLNDWAERIAFKLDHHDDMSDAMCCLEVYKYLSPDTVKEDKNTFTGRLL